MPARTSPATTGTATATAAAPVSGRVSEATAEYSATHVKTAQRSSDRPLVTRRFSRTQTLQCHEERGHRLRSLTTRDHRRTSDASVHAVTR